MVILKLVIIVFFFSPLATIYEFLSIVMLQFYLLYAFFFLTVDVKYEDYALGWALITPPLPLPPAPLPEDANGMHMEQGTRDAQVHSSDRNQLEINLQ